MRGPEGCWRVLRGVEWSAGVGMSKRAPGKKALGGDAQMQAEIESLKQVRCQPALLASVSVVKRRHRGIWLVWCGGWCGGVRPV